MRSFKAGDVVIYIGINNRLKGKKALIKSVNPSLSIDIKWFDNVLRSKDDGCWYQDVFILDKSFNDSNLVCKKIK